MINNMTDKVLNYQHYVIILNRYLFLMYEMVKVLRMFL